MVFREFTSVSPNKGLPLQSCLIILRSQFSNLTGKTSWYNVKSEAMKWYKSISEDSENIMIICQNSVSECFSCLRHSKINSHHSTTFNFSVHQSFPLFSKTVFVFFVKTIIFRTWRKWKSNLYCLVKKYEFKTCKSSHTPNQYMAYNKLSCFIQA